MIGLELYPGLGSRTYLIGDLEDCGLVASTFRKLKKIFDFPGEIRRGANLTAIPFFRICVTFSPFNIVDFVKVVYHSILCTHTAAATGMSS